MSRINISYDLDGTLIDSSQSLYESIKFACNQENVKVPDYQLFRSFIGPPIQFYLKELLGIDSIKEEKIIRNFREHHDNKGYKSYLVFDQIINVLDYFKRKDINQYLITNKPEELTLKTISYLNMSSFFKQIYSTRKKGEKKKNKSFFLKRLNSNNTTYYIGDTAEDQIEAEKSNCKFIYANYGYGKIKYPKCKINEPNELINLIQIE